VDAIVGIIVVLFVVLGLIKRALEHVSGQEEGRAGASRGYEATPDEVREFLESLRTAHRPAQAEAQPMQEEAGPVRVALPQEQAQVLPPVGGDVLERPFTVPDVEPWRSPPATRRRRRAPAERTEARRRPVAAPKPEQPPGLPVAAAGLVPPLALKRMSLRDAIVWSEILGKPVSLRARRPGPPERRRDPRV